MYDQDASATRARLPETEMEQDGLLVNVTIGGCREVARQEHGVNST